MKCKKCGKETSNPKFCSRSCSASASNKGRNRHTGEIVGVRRCPICELVLSYEQKRYCSYECASEGRYEASVNDWLAGDSVGHTKAGVLRSPVKRWLRELQNGKCALCHRSEWTNDNYNKPIPLEGDHVDGNWKNSRPENIRLICPTCHALTPTYRGKNRGSGRAHRKGGRDNAIMVND